MAIAVKRAHAAIIFTSVVFFSLFCLRVSFMALFIVVIMCCVKSL